MILGLIARIILQDCPFTVYERSVSKTHLVKFILKTFNLPKNRTVVLWLPNLAIGGLILLTLWKLHGR